MDPQFSNASTNNIYELLKEMIFDWRLSPGEKINVSSLARKLNISPIPLREALSRFHSTKLVLFEPNKGYRVSEILHNDEMLQLMKARNLIEQYAITQVIRNNQLDIVETLQHITERMIGLNVKNSYKEVLKFVHLDSQFHSTIIDKAYNTFLSEAYFGMYSHLHIARFYRARGGVDQDEATDEHWKIIDAIKKRDIFKAKLSVEKHIKDAKNRLLRKDTDAED